MGRDHTLFALVAGRVKISKKELPGDKTCAEIANISCRSRCAGGGT